MISMTIESGIWLANLILLSSSTLAVYGLFKLLLLLSSFYSSVKWDQGQHFSDTITVKFKSYNAYQSI